MLFVSCRLLDADCCLLIVVCYVLIVFFGPCCCVVACCCTVSDERSWMCAVSCGGLLVHVFFVCLLFAVVCYVLFLFVLSWFLRCVGVV